MWTRAATRAQSERLAEAYNRSTKNHRSAPVADVVELDVETAPATGKPCGRPYEAEKNFRVAEATALRLVPYHRWDNRDPATTRAWLPVMTDPAFSGGTRCGWCAVVHDCP